MCYNTLFIVVWKDLKGASSVSILIKMTETLESNANNLEIKVKDIGVFKPDWKDWIPGYGMFNLFPRVMRDEVDSEDSEVVKMAMYIPLCVNYNAIVVAYPLFEFLKSIK